jgi:hypothetical protein
LCGFDGNCFNAGIAFGQRSGTVCYQAASGDVATISAPGGLVLRIHFTPRDLARVTLSTKPAPLWEILLSLHMLQHSDGRLVFDDWRRHVRTKVAPDQMRLLLELTPPRGYSPDFLTPADCPSDFDSALELALSTPRQQIRSQLDLLSKYRPVSPWTRELAQGDRTAMRKLGHAIRTYHDAAIAPYWKSIGTHVTADQAHRGEALARHGVDRLLSSLHPRVRWVAPVLQVLDMHDRDLYLDGRGIELQPSAFCWQVPTKLRDPELKPILVYPIQRAGHPAAVVAGRRQAVRRAQLAARLHARVGAGGSGRGLYDDRARQALQHLPRGGQPPGHCAARGRADHHPPGRRLGPARGHPAGHLAALRLWLRRSARVRLIAASRWYCPIVHGVCAARPVTAR